MRRTFALLVAPTMMLTLAPVSGAGAAQDACDTRVDNTRKKLLDWARAHD